MDKYDVLSFLGKGAYGTVMKVENKKTKEIFAWKKIQSYSGRMNVEKEIEIIKRCNQNPKVVQYSEHLKLNDSYNIIMEYCPENLENILIEKPGFFKRFNKQPMGVQEYFLSIHMFKDLVECVKSIHDLNIIHRDLKPSNILVSLQSKNGLFFKLSDFGISTLTPGYTALHTRGIGTVNYLAPEVNEGKDGKALYSIEADIYSLGIILREIFGFPHNFERGDNFLLNKGLILEKLSVRMLEKSYSKRPKTAEILNLKNLWNFPREKIELCVIENRITESEADEFFKNFNQEKLSNQPQKFYSSSNSHSTPFLVIGIPSQIEKSIKFMNIMEIIELKEISEYRYNLKIHTLEQLLKPFHNKHIVLIATVGNSTEDKSIYLNHMIRYLSNHINNQSAEKLDTPLKGFDWKTHIKPETSGIWMSPPYLFKRSDGQEIGIILMDTQGVFDKYSNERDWSTIVGISLLVSSCLIIDLNSDLQEESLNFLEKYLENGLLAIKEVNKEEKNKPFQKLLFSIKDWNMLSQYAYRKEIRGKYWRGKLKDEKQQHEKDKKSFELLKRSFRHLECFLMPYIVNSPKEKDKESVEESMEKFTRFLDTLKEIYFDTERFCTIIPKMEQSTIVGKEIVEYFRSFFQLSNRNIFPTDGNLIAAKQRADFRIYLDKIMNNKVEKLRTIILEAEGFLERKKLNELVETIKEELISELKKQKYYNKERIIDKYESTFNEIYEENDTRIIEAIKKCLKNFETYKRMINNLVDKDFMDPLNLTAKIQELKNIVLYKFDDIYNDEGVGHLSQEGIKLFYEVNKIEKDVIISNRESRDKYEKIFKESSEKSFNYFKDQLLTKLEENKISNLVLIRKVKDDLRQKTLNFFMEEIQRKCQMLKLNSHYDLKYENQLNMDIENHLNDKFKDLIINLQLDSAIQSYQTNIKDFMDGLQSMTVLEKKHKQFENNALRQFISDCQTTDENSLQTYKEEFHRRVKEFYKQIKSLMEKRQQRYQLKAGEIKEIYVKDMAKFIFGKDNFTQEELKHHHKKLRTDKIATYKDSLQTNEIIAIILIEINELFDLYLKKIHKNIVNYRRKMCILFTDDKFYSDKTLENIQMKYQRDALNNLRFNFENEKGEELSSINYEDKIRRKIELEFKNFSEMNRDKRNNFFSKKFEESSKQYKLDMEKIIKLNKNEEMNVISRKMENHHKLCIGKYLKQLKHQIIWDSRLCHDHEQYLNKEFKKIVKEISDNFRYET